jgi:hypothetical protein
MRLQAALHFSSEAHVPGQLFGLGSHGTFACGALCGELVDDEDDCGETDGRYDVGYGMPASSFGVPAKLGTVRCSRAVKAASTTFSTDL